MSLENKFEVWIDSLDKDIILHAKSLGLLHGVTTNPTILSRHDPLPLKSIATALELFEGPLGVQVTHQESEQMIKQAKALYALSNRIIVKIPCVEEGYKAMYALQQEGIPVLATAIYTLRQYHLASLFGAKYAAPYYSRMIKRHKEESANLETAAQKSLEIVTQMLNLSRKNKTKVMLAALESPCQLDDLVCLGLEVATLPAEVYKKWLGDFPKSVADLNKFSEDWHLNIHAGDWL